MRRIIISGLLLFFYVPFTDAGYPVVKHSFSINEAVSFALENNNNIKNAELDILTAKKEVWATTSIGLPQVNGSYDYQHLPGTLPTLSFPDPDGGFQKITLGVRNSANFNITVSQLVFSGEYIVGLQATRTFLQLSSNAKEKSEQDIKEAVILAYYTVLILQKNRETLDSAIQNIFSILNETRVMYEQGFLEETDYEQLQVTRNTLVNTDKAIERQVQLAYMLLKIQLGLSVEDEIQLTDNLDMLLLELNSEQLISFEFDINNNIEYQLLKLQERMSELSLNREKSKYLPTVSAFYLYQDKTRKADFDITFNNIIGVNVNVPIFSSGQRLARVQQARINLEKSRNTSEQVSEMIAMAAEQARADFKTSYEKYLVEKESINLALKIYEKTQIKYKQGVASSMDLSLTNNQYLESYSGYTSSILELLTAKIKFEKALSNL